MQHSAAARKTLSQAPIYKSANAQIFSHYESANKLPRKRNIDRYREPQQRFAIRRQALRSQYGHAAVTSAVQHHPPGISHIRLEICDHVADGHRGIVRRLDERKSYDFAAYEII